MQDHSFEVLTLTTITKRGMVMSRVYRLSPIKRIFIHFNFKHQETESKLLMPKAGLIVSYMFNRLDLV